MSTVVETDVLIVGSGPAGASAALALSSYGVPNIVVTRYASLADTPRAHITNQRTMEVLRDLGVEQDVIAQATPQHLMGNTTFCTSLVGEELGRVRSWGNDPLVQAAHELASPTRMCDMPQHLMEPVLVDAAVARGTSLRFQTEYLSHTQDADGVTATVRDRLRGDTYEIRAKYLIGADGGRSKVAEDAGLPMSGQMGVVGSINIVFEADLGKYTAHRPSTLYWVLAPGATVGGIGAGLVRCVRPWNEWMIVWGYDVTAGAPDLTTEYAESVVRQLIGDDEIPVTVKSSSAWTVNEMYAETYSQGRVFCAGDATHRHPPSNGLGSNTSIQDSYNLAWKLKLVLDGTASPKLLDTYTTERAPVGKQVVTRANRSIGETAPIFEALDGLSPQTPEQLWANIAARKDSRRGRREAAGQAPRGHRLQGVRVQRARRGPQPAVRLGRGRPGRVRRGDLRARPRTPPPAHLPPRRPRPARLAHLRHPHPLHPRHRREGPLHPADRHRRRGLDPGREGAGRRDRHRGHRSRTAVPGPVRRLGAPERDLRQPAPCSYGPTGSSPSGTRPRPRTPRRCSRTRCGGSSVTPDNARPWQKRNAVEQEEPG